jgi:hypothetical protein
VAIISPPAWLQAGSYPARTDRLAAITSMLWYAGFAADESAPLRPRQGVRPSYQGIQLKVRAASTPNMTVIINAGMAFIDNHDTNGYGTYVLVNDADAALNIPAAGGAGQFRKDSICLSVYDSETAGGSDLARLEVISGPYAASAGATVRGTIPPNGIVLADVAIAPSQTSVTNSNITDARNFTVGLGGIAPIPSTIAPNHPHPGQIWYEPDLDRFRYGKSDGSIAEILGSFQTVGRENFRIKGADTNRATATLTSDPDLTFSLDANATYEFEGDLYIGTTDATQADFTMDWTIPSGAAGRWAAVGIDALDSSTTGTAGSIRLVTTVYGSGTRSYAGISTTVIPVVKVSGIVRTTAGGTFALSWARSGTSGSAILKADSFLRATRRV